MSNNLSVKITADIVDLQTKFAVAKAEVNGLTAEMNKLARASATGIIDSAGQARLQQVAGDLLAARTQAGQYAGAIEKAGFATGSLTRATAMSHGQISTATREFCALFDELSSGRTRYTPGTLAIIANKVLGLQASTLAAAGGVAALVGGLALLAYRASQASSALDQMHLNALVADTGATRAQFDQLVQALSLLPGVSASAAQSIATAFSGVKGMTFDAVAASARLAAEQIGRTGEKADKVAPEYAKMLDSARSAVSVAKEIGGLTQAQVDEAIAADHSQNSNAVLAEKLKLLDLAASRARGSVAEYSQTWGQAIQKYLLFVGAADQGISTDEVRNEILKDQTSLWGKNAAAIEQNTAALAAAPAKAPLVYDQGSTLDKMREKITELAATWDGTQSGMLAKQLATARSFLAQTQQSSKDYLAIQQELARLEVQYRRAAGEEIIADARTRISELGTIEGTGAAQRLADQAAVWQKTLESDRLTAAQRAEVQRSLNRTLSEIQHQRAAEAEAIARSDAQTNLQISRMKIEAERQAVEAMAVTDAAGAAHRIATLKDLVNQEYALNLESLQAELAMVKDNPAEYERVYNQIRELKERNVLDLAGLDRRYTQESARYGQQQVTMWRSAVGEIENVEGTMVSDLVSKRRSLSQSLLQIGSDLVQKELTNDLRAMTTRLLLANTEQVQQKALEQGGYLYHLAISLAKTGASTTSEAAQTSATISGLTARQSAEAAAAATSQTMRRTIGGQTVMADAAKAFSGTYASVSSIPVVGWVLAPFAAAGAFAAVAAYEGMASLDVGAWNVPQDMTARIHKGESVVPTTFAEGMRKGGSGFGGSAHHYHIHAVDARSFADLLDSNSDAVGVTVNKLIRMRGLGPGIF